jgi:hypothetical protein
MPARNVCFSKWQRACNEVELRLRAQKVRTEMKRFEPLSVPALGLAEANV